MNLLELTDYLVAAAALLIGLHLGRRMRPKPPEPLRPICSCDHGYGSHHSGGNCAGKEREPSKYDKFGETVAWKMVQCTCTRYDGPDPLILGIEPAGGDR